MSGRTRPARRILGLTFRVCGGYNRALTMRLFMQTQAAGKDAPRYYQIMLEQDLLGGWTLFREWGLQGGRASSKREIYLERESAVAAFEQARDAQVKRGFLVMFSQGFDGPRSA